MHLEEIHANEIIEKVIQNLSHIEFEKEVTIGTSLDAQNDVILQIKPTLPMSYATSSKTV
ncbi:MAG: hypothetical protein IPO37_19890 [Saprospiraceae bacterium]|nr:hypothetical protein [Saprospiraceae bacterium]